MSEIVKFECNATGAVFGARNDLYEFSIKTQRGKSPFENRERDIHFSLEWMESKDFSFPHNLVYVGVRDGEIKGAKMTYRMHGEEEYQEWEERGNVMTEKYEEFFKFVEENLVY